VDTLKSLAVITLLGAVLYGVYVVASKPDKPLPADLEAMAESAEGPVIEGGSSLSAPTIESAGSNSTAPEHRGHSHFTPRMKHADADSHSAVEVAKESSVPPEDPLSRRTVTSAPAEKLDVATAESPTIKKLAYTPKAIETPSDDYAAEPKKPVVEKPRSVEITSGQSSAATDADIEAAKQRIRLYAFQMAWKTARDQVSQGRHREALLALTPFYGDSAIPADQHEELVGWLDALAAKVVYSTEHLLEPAHIVHRGETLYMIANKYHVPYMLLKNINAVRDNDVLLPNSSLKVITGPFQAEVDLSRQEVTVFVRKLYAGRFPFTLGPEPAPPGEYLVKAKEPAKSYSSAQGVLGPKDPRNPYGGLFIDLGHGVSMHGSPGEAYADQRVGCIQLAPRDAEDLFAILSKDESTVTIHK
jgi:LysM repeat protein